jgi:hypothetical protein
MQHELKIVSLQQQLATTSTEVAEQKRRMFESYGEVVTVSAPLFALSLSSSLSFALLFFLCCARGRSLTSASALGRWTGWRRRCTTRPR